MLQGMIKEGSFEADVYETHVSIRVLEGVKGTCAVLWYEPDFPIDGSEYVFLPAVITAFLFSP